jgi:transcriptional regulator with XRE-family HTH domain
MAENKGFDGDAFYRALEGTVGRRGKNWKQVASETGVSASTLARMAQGRRPDAASLAALSAWSGLNPSDFVDAPYKTRPREPLTQISSLLRSDPNLDAQGAAAVEAIVRAAYERLRKIDADEESNT